MRKVATKLKQFQVELKNLQGDLVGVEICGISKYWAKELKKAIKEKKKEISRIKGK